MRCSVVDFPSECLDGPQTPKSVSMLHDSILLILDYSLVLYKHVLTVNAIEYAGLGGDEVG